MYIMEIKNEYEDNFFESENEDNFFESENEDNFSESENEDNFSESENEDNFSESENDSEHENEMNSIFEAREDRKAVLERLIYQEKYIKKIENKTLILKSKYNNFDGNYKVKPYILNCDVKNMIYINNEYNFKNFIREIDYQFHEIILLNKYIKPYFDFDNGLDLKSIIDNIKKLIKDNYNIKLVDDDFIIYHRISKNGINKYHISLKYKIWSNTFFNLMTKQNGEIFDIQIYKGIRSLRNPYCYKMELNNEETNSSSFYYKYNFYITEDTRYHRINTKGEIIKDNYKIIDSVISFTDPMYKILGTRENIIEVYNNHLPKIAFKNLEVNKRKIISYLQKKLSEKITGEEVNHNFIEYNPHKNIYEFKFTNIKRKCGHLSHCECKNKFYKCPTCDNDLVANGFIKLSDNNYTCFHFEKECKGFKIIDVDEKDFNNEINNVLSQINHKFNEVNVINFKENHINYISGIPGCGKTYYILSELLKTDKINLIIVNRTIQAYSIKNEINKLDNQESYIIDQETFKKMYEFHEDLKGINNIICLSPSIWKLEKLFDCDILQKNNYNLFIDEYIQYIETITTNSADNKIYTKGIRSTTIPQLIKNSYSCFISDVIFDKNSIKPHLSKFEKELTFSKFNQVRNKIDNLTLSNDITLLEQVIEENIQNNIPMFIWCDLKYKLYNIYNKYFKCLPTEDVLILEAETDEKLKTLNEQKHKFILASPTVFSAISIRPYKTDIFNRVTIGITHNRIVSFYNFINAIQRDRTCKSMYLFSNIFNKINNFIDHKSYSINKDICTESEIDYLKILGNYSSLNIYDCLYYIPFLKINNEIKFNSKFNSEWFDKKDIKNNIAKNLLHNVSLHSFYKIKEFILNSRNKLKGLLELELINKNDINKIKFEDFNMIYAEDDDKIKKIKFEDLEKFHVDKAIEYLNKYNDKIAEYEKMSNDKKTEELKKSHEKTVEELYESYKNTTPLFTDFFQNYIYNILTDFISLQKNIPYYYKYFDEIFKNPKDYSNDDKDSYFDEIFKNPKDYSDDDKDSYFEKIYDISSSCISEFNKIIFNYRKENRSNLVKFDKQIPADSNLKIFIANKEYIQECEKLIKLKEKNEEIEFWEMLTELFNNKNDEVMMKLKVTINNIELTPEISITKNRYGTKQIQKKFKFDKTLTKDKYTNGELRDKFNSLDNIRGFINFNYGCFTKYNKINMKRIKLDEIKITRNY